MHKSSFIGHFHHFQNFSCFSFQKLIINQVLPLWQSLGSSFLDPIEDNQNLKYININKRDNHII